MPWAIYCHTHIETERRYVGLTKRTIERRWSQHVCQARRSKGGRWHFPNAIRKYGAAAFSHKVLEVCDTLEEANEREEYWINHFNTRDPEKGFNIAKGGEHVPHPIKKNPWKDPARRAKLAEAVRLAKANPAVKAKASATSKKLWQDPEFRDKVASANKKAWSDPAMRTKSSEINKEIKARPKVKAQASKHSKAMWESEEYRKKNAKLWKDPDFRERCQTGLVHGAQLNRNKTHCRNGHEYTEENTYVNKRGSRECRTCARKSKRESAKRVYKQRKLESVV
jgi:group I intron endonuclease